MTWVSETSLESDAVSYNISNESCAAWISRDGLSSGIAGLQVELQNCAVVFPEVRDHATYLGDLLVIFHDFYHIYIYISCACQWLIVIHQRGYVTFFGGILSVPGM